MMEALTPNTTFALDENTTLSGILEQQPTFSDSNSSSSSSSNSNSNVENGNGTTMQYTNIEDSLKNKSIKDDKEIENVRKYTIKSIENDDSDNENGNSYWDVLILYLPVLFLWFRRSMFGSANLIRSIVVGQLMRLILKENFSEWISERAHLPPWLQVLLFQSSSAISTTCTGNSSSSASSTILGACAGSGKLDPHAWPPPAFTALALLTIFALVVHPDGITWIMLGKFRDVILTILSTLGQCWEFLVNDYGVFPTIAAATTFATLLFLVFVVLRTLSPKNRPANGTNDHNVHPHNEKKRRKKKGGNARHRRDHHHHRSNRIKHTTRLVTENNVPLPTHQETPVSSCPISTLQPSNNDSHASLPSRPLSSLDTAANSSRNRPVTFSSSSSALSSISSTETGCAPLSTSVHGTPSAGCEDATMSTISTGTKSNRVDSSANAVGKDFRGRRRMISSGSTIDTTSMSDDQSCGSTSVRSYPSVSVNSNRSGGNGGGVDKITNNSNRTKRKGIGGNPRRGKHSSNVKSPKNNSNRNVGRETKAPVETSVSSRWDALKPGHSDCKNNIISSSRHHHRANGNLNSNKNHHQYQQQQQRYHRGNNRLGHRGGNNGNGTNRKGRHLTVNEPLVIDRNPAMTISGSSSPHSSNKAALTTKSSSARPSSSVLNEKSLPIASTIIRHHDLATSSSPLCTSNAASPSLNPFTSPSSKFMPPPPPGFQETTKENLHFKEDISTFPPPKLFDTSLPQIIDSWRTEVSSTAPLTAIPQRIDNSPEFFPLSSSTATIQENPFTNNNISTTTLSHQHSNRLDSQIEADLQELGGQMAGSILDF